MACRDRCVQDQVCKVLISFPRNPTDGSVLGAEGMNTQNEALQGTVIAVSLLPNVRFRRLLGKFSLLEL